MFGSVAATLPNTLETAPSGRKLSRNQPEVIVLCIPDMATRAEICTTVARLTTEDPAACDGGERRGGIEERGTSNTLVGFPVVAAALALVVASGALVTMAAARASTQMAIRLKASGGLATSSKIAMGIIGSTMLPLVCIAALLRLRRTRPDLFGGGKVDRLWVSVMRRISTRKRTSTPPTTAKALCHWYDDVLLAEGSGREGLLRLKSAFSVDGMS